MLGRSAALLALLILGGAAVLATPQPPAAQPSPPAAAGATRARSARTASYVITARLDPKSRTLTGDEILTWRNASTAPARTLRFHLYYNAWRNTNSTWMRERRLAGNTDLLSRPREDWGWSLTAAPAMAI